MQKFLIKKKRKERKLNDQNQNVQNAERITIFTPKKGVKEKVFKQGSFLEGFAERKLE